MAKALTIVGTNSSAGKSFLVTALGKILRRQGLKVAPFKAQNMSLQSYVCKDGGEIGLAQALQSFACSLEPESSFNPILLKPEGEGKSQVILCGKVYKVLTSEEYYQEREKLWDKVKDVLLDLTSRYEIILLEGAGSPAEINLLQVDIVNIKPALYLKSPVLLIGDIDKGGVFASLYGTVELLKRLCPEYKSLIKGFVINKFRGSMEILKPGLTQLFELTGIPTLGVIPYKDHLNLSDEDGFSFFNKRTFLKKSTQGAIKIVILKLSHISNFSDFDPFYIEDDVDLVYSLRREDILNADIIILPGSKNTFSDLKRLQELEMDKILREALKRGAEIIGICGGFQMLCEVLKNPYGVESPVKERKGLGLLSGETIFYPEKITTQVKAHLLEKNLDTPLWGYEIHKGITVGNLNLFRIERISTGETLLDGIKEGQVWGTYLHGLFTNDVFRGELLNRHRIKKGLKPRQTFPAYWQTLEKSFDFMAKVVEESIDMRLLYKWLKL